ncbi:MAG TPA: nucleoside recognition domain-containing protein, partial [Clostridia bacterium]|nr:nucleoside recognition domain-containing protein [Clostridia bacterium]
VAAPAGLIIWVAANTYIGSRSTLDVLAAFFEPLGRIMGLDGYILLAFILGLPANEIVLPIIIMSYTQTGGLLELESLAGLRKLLVNHGWTWVTALCFMLFMLMHFPCATTCWTIKKETRSWKWTAAAFLIPTVAGIIICALTAAVARLVAA